MNGRHVQGGTGDARLVACMRSLCQQMPPTSKQQTANQAFMVDVDGDGKGLQVLSDWRHQRMQRIQ